MNLDDVLKQLSAKTKLDNKESSDGLWEVNEADLFRFLKEHAGANLPYPLFCSPVGGYMYLYFVTETFKLPICVRLDNESEFRRSLQQVYQKVVRQNATV